MLPTLKRLLLRYRAEGHEGIETPIAQAATFVLTYDALVVGHLQLKLGNWEFRYAPEFIEQTELQPLVDFPDLEKVYRSEDLWPFFIARIPSVEQPGIKETIEKEGLDARSDVELLRRFGKRTITNPFVLQESS